MKLSFFVEEMRGKQRACENMLENMDEMDNDDEQETTSPSSFCITMAKKLSKTVLFPSPHLNKLAAVDLAILQLNCDGVAWKDGGE